MGPGEKTGKPPEGGERGYVMYQIKKETIDVQRDHENCTYRCIGKQQWQHEEPLECHYTLPDEIGLHLQKHGMLYGVLL